MNLVYWIQEAIRRGWKAFLLAIVAAFVLTNSATAALKLVLDGGAFTPQRTLSIWVNSAMSMVQGDGVLSVIAVGLVAGVGTILSYTWHNLISENFDGIIGCYIAALGVLPFVFSSSIPDIIPVWLVAMLPVLAGLYFITWQAG